MVLHTHYRLQLSVPNKDIRIPCRYCHIGVTYVHQSARLVSRTRIGNLGSGIAWSCQASHLPDSFVLQFHPLFPPLLASGILLLYVTISSLRDVLLPDFNAIQLPYKVPV
jgi:hypothetical protein